MEGSCIETIQDTNSPHTPVSTGNNNKTPNNDGSITRSYMHRMQELRPRKYSQKFMEIRDVFEKEKQLPKFPNEIKSASITLPSKFERSVINRFELTESPQKYTERQRARARSSLAQKEDMSPEDRMKRVSVVFSSLCGSPKKVSWLLDGNEGQDGANEPSLLLNISQQCCVNKEEVPEQGKEEPNQKKDPKQDSQKEQKSQQEQQLATVIQQRSGKVSSAKHEQELQEQLQQIEELQHNQEAQLEQLVFQIQKLHIQETQKYSKQQQQQFMQPLPALPQHEQLTLEKQQQKQQQPIPKQEQEQQQPKHPLSIFSMEDPTPLAKTISMAQNMR